MKQIIDRVKFLKYHYVMTYEQAIEQAIKDFPQEVKELEQMFDVTNEDLIKSIKEKI